MENASKALLIAGGVLIAILVASLGVYFSNNISDSTSRIYSQLEDNQRTEFNQQFLNYNDHTNLTIQDVVTIINLVKDSNKKNEFDDAYANSFNPNNDKSLYIAVEYTGESSYQLGTSSYSSSYSELQNLKDEDLAKLLSEEMSKNMLITYFTCKVSVNTNTGYVNYIEIGI